MMAGVSVKGRTKPCCAWCKKKNVLIYCLNVDFQKKDFCSELCLHDFKLAFLNLTCAFCKNEITKNVDNGKNYVLVTEPTIKDFCNQDCLQKYRAREKSSQVKKQKPKPQQTIHHNFKVTGVFDWDEYLEECNAVAAPLKCFKQCSESPINEFKLNMKLETHDPRNESSMCIATVVNIIGPLLKLRLDGTDNNSDFWELCDSSVLHPIGHCEKNGGMLQPPLGFRMNTSFWPAFLKKTLNGASIAPQEIFMEEPPTPKSNKFKIGYKLEAIDLKNPPLIYPATVTDVKDDTILITFDGWPGTFDYYCRFDDRHIFPVGWCTANGVILQHPGNTIREIRPGPITCPAIVPRLTVKAPSASTESPLICTRSKVTVDKPINAIKGKKSKKKKESLKKTKTFVKKSLRKYADHYVKIVGESKTFPSKWRVVKVPRRIGHHIDVYYYPPSGSPKLRSKLEVERYCKKYNITRPPDLFLNKEKKEEIKISNEINSPYNSLVTSNAKDPIIENINKEKNNKKNKLKKKKKKSALKQLKRVVDHEKEQHVDVFEEQRTDQQEKSKQTLVLKLREKVPTCENQQQIENLDKNKEKTKNTLKEKCQDKSVLKTPEKVEVCAKVQKLENLLNAKIIERNKLKKRKHDSSHSESSKRLKVCLKLARIDRKTENELSEKKQEKSVLTPSDKVVCVKVKRIDSLLNVEERNKLLKKKQENSDLESPEKKPICTKEPVIDSEEREVNKSQYKNIEKSPQKLEVSTNILSVKKIVISKDCTKNEPLEKNQNITLPEKLQSHANVPRVENSLERNENSMLMKKNRDKLVVKLPEISAYINHRCACGPYLNPRKISKMPVKLGPASPNRLLQKTMQTFIDCSENEKSVFSLLKSGVGGAKVTANFDGEMHTCRLPAVDNATDFWKYLENIYEDLMCCENFYTGEPLNYGCMKCENKRPISEIPVNKMASDPGMPPSQWYSLPSNTHSVTNLMMRQSSSNQVTCIRPYIKTELDLFKASKWTTDEVIQYMCNANQNMSAYADLFRKHEIDGKALLLLNSDMIIKYMGLKLGPALKICSLIEKLKDKNSK